MPENQVTYSPFYAHSTDNPSGDDWQLLRDHLLSVSSLAAERAEKFGCGRAGAVSGQGHDVGKYTTGFQRRLCGGPRVDHATAGAALVRDLARTQDESVIAELISYAIAGHHAGLPDMSGRGEGTLRSRLGRLASMESLHPAWKQEISLDCDGILPSLRFEKDRLPFQLQFLTRMLFSCLVDADYRDTEAFYSRCEGVAPERDWLALQGIVEELTNRIDQHLTRIKHQATETTLNAARSEILEHARSKAAMSPGFFTMTVPTGGGKTLASLAFALDHARHHRMHRVVYAIPYTAIIEQTAGIFREVLGDDVVLEHHSFLEEPENTGREGLSKLRLAMEDWAAPVVVTTNVQLFESLFADRPSRCRKLHNLAGSVIVLDEAQTLPLALLRPCMAVLDELVRNYGVTVVFCTATQPALGAHEIDGGLPFSSDRELCPRPHEMSRLLRRTSIEHVGEMRDGELLAALSQVSQGLVIVNSRRHALELYQQGAAAGMEGLYHLTTRQHAVDRRAKLEQIRDDLKQNRPCRVIATSLVEAGVDIDFPRVWRAEAGLDQIVQAAGRCNREGNAREGVVTVFSPTNRAAPKSMRTMISALSTMARTHDDWLSLDAMATYFGEVYWARGPALDAHNILDAFRMDSEGTDFAFRTVAKKFRMIETSLVPVVVATDPAAGRVLASLDKRIRPGQVARKLQPYVVLVPEAARARMLRNEEVVWLARERWGEQFAVLQRADLYSEEYGLVWESVEALEHSEQERVTT